LAPSTVAAGSLVPYRNAMPKEARPQGTPAVTGAREPDRQE
jgi:hypothetical protein